MPGLRFARSTSTGWKWFSGPAGGEPAVDTATPPVSAARTRVGGIGGATKEQTAAALPLIRSAPGGFTALRARWVDLQPSPGPLATAEVASLAASLEWAQDLGLPVLLRVEVDPSWLPAAWWSPGYLDARRDLMAALAAAPGVGDCPALAVVGSGMPLSHGFSDATVRAGALAAGYTLEDDLAATRSTLDAMADVWAPLDVSTMLTLVPHEGVLPDGSLETSVDRSVEMGEYLIARLGSLAVLSLGGFTSAASGPLVDWAASEVATPLHVRMASLARHTADGVTPAMTVERAIAIAACSVELSPGATDGWSTEQAADFNARLRANLAV